MAGREPTEAMLVAGNAMFHSGEVPLNIWRAMHDAQLAGEAKLAAWRSSDPEAQPEGTVEALATCATMLETYGPECFPANERGQVHFARAMLDATAAEIRAYLAAVQLLGLNAAQASA